MGALRLVVSSDRLVIARRFGLIFSRRPATLSVHSISSERRTLRLFSSQFRRTNSDGTARCAPSYLQLGNVRRHCRCLLASPSVAGAKQRSATLGKERPMFTLFTRWLGRRRLSKQHCRAKRPILHRRLCPVERL